MGKPRRRVLISLIAAFVVLACGIVVALSDAGLPLAAAVVVVALLICILAIVSPGFVGYRNSRNGGRGFWRSVGSGVRVSLRTVFDLF
jgi:hypothetical protein